LREMVARALKLGGKVVAGTDVEYADKYRLQDELTALVQLRMPPLDAIEVATSTAADCLMISGRTGSIKPGLEADLIAVDRDPTVAIDALRDVLLVVNNGTVVVKRFGP
jgi:imidazolonepropionase-like amidohydrolase